MANNIYYAQGHEAIVKQMQAPLLASIVVDGTLISSDIAQWVLHLIRTEPREQSDEIRDDAVHIRYPSAVVELFNGMMKQLREAEEVTDDLLEHLVYYCDVRLTRSEQFKSEVTALLAIIRSLELVWDSEIGEIQLDPSGVFLILQNSGTKEDESVRTSKELIYSIRDGSVHVSSRICELDDDEDDEDDDEDANPDGW